MWDVCIEHVLMEIMLGLSSVKVCVGGTRGDLVVGG